MFETQKSGNKTRSGEIGLNIRTLASPKVGQDQVFGGVSVFCWHAAPVANVLWKPLGLRDPNLPTNYWEFYSSMRIYHTVYLIYPSDVHEYCTDVSTIKSG